MKGAKMQAYQFIATVTADGKLSIPAQYTQALLADDKVQVLVLLAETNTAHLRGESQDLEGTSLEQLVAEIQQLPPDPAMIEPTSGSLADYLANTPNERNLNFDASAWNEKWDTLEAIIIKRIFWL
jgi:hypothetical protein